MAETQLKKSAKHIWFKIFLITVGLLTGFISGFIIGGQYLTEYRYNNEAGYWRQMGYEDGYRQTMKNGLEEMLRLEQSGQLTRENLQEIWR
ncbi:MAG: hypothetical protein ACOX6L_00415 [Syntrophomonadaceae bacterium]|jgi:hypothetical protein